VDVAIVGGGYTGLWTAYELRRADPSLRVVVLEAESVGFGASGRNGGWCSALLPMSLDALERAHGRAAAIAMQRAMFATVDEVARVARAEGIDAHIAKGGTIELATNPAHVTRLHHHLDTWRRYGFGEEDIRWLDRAEARDRVAAEGTLGALFSPHCAALHPARLVDGLASAAERAGAVIHERTRVRAITPGVAATEHGDVRADVVVRATEGYTATLRGERRSVAPVYSLMIATEPLPGDVWDGIGLRERETFHDARHVVIYGQRTADGRLAFGGRGAPYHWGSGIDPAHERRPDVFARLATAMAELFPALAGVAITHTWGGPLGVPRDWHCSVGLDRATGLAWAGGYVGDGVATTNLAGRTLADLVLRRDTDLTALAWVGHRSRRWEPEPLRWLGINGARRLAEQADRAERRTGRPSRLAGGIKDRLTGG
jgi:glycine/D-amino acid oxidase-like deaminating enzyme